MGALLQDVRYGLRMLAKSPGFTAIAILTLALGIGANTAIFSLIDAVMLRALPAENPSQLVLLKWGARHAPIIHGYMSSGDCVNDLKFGAANPSGCSFSEPMFREIVESNTFAGVAAFANSNRLDLSGNGPASVIDGQVVSGDFFHTLGVKAAAGRLIEPGDDSPGAVSVAVLNYGYWQSAFGGAQSALGRTIELNNVPFTIIGVAEQRFTGITPGSDYDVWLPLADAQRITDPARWGNRQGDVAYWWLTVVGRLKAGMGTAQAQATVSGLFRNEMLHGAAPLFERGGGPGGSVVPGAPGGGGTRQMMVMGGPPPGAGAPAPGPGNGPVVIPLKPGQASQAPGNAGPRGDMVFGGPMAGGGPVQLPPPAGKPGEFVNRQLPGPDTREAPVNGTSGVPKDEAGQPATLSSPSDEPTLTLISAQSGLTGSRTQYSNPLYVLMLAVGIILLIACANVAGLMLARSAARQKEMAVRLVLGAGRARVIRQLLTESVMLSALGGALGILFAYWGAHAIVSFVSNNQARPLGFTAGVDTHVLGFTIGVSLFTGILFGIAPAFRSARIDLTPALKEGEGGTAGARGRWFSAGNTLVVAQMALAIVVLVGAGLLVRTLENLRAIDVGFDSRNLVIFGIDPSLAGYKDAQIDSFYNDLRERLAETPGVKSVSYSQIPLLSGAFTIMGFHWPGTPQDQQSEANTLAVGPDFFQTMQIPFLAGRGFNASDYAQAAANTSAEIAGRAPSAAPTPAIVNQMFVEKFIGKENPLGKQFGESPASDMGPASPGYEIVGVVRDAKYNSLRREINPTMYIPQSRSGASFEVRTVAQPAAMVPAIRDVVAKMNANLPLFNVTTESEQIDRLLFQERLIARLSGFFGILALALACIGLYGLLAYEVARRTREIGIRMALGAQQWDVLRLVVRQGITLAVAGAIAGIGVALAVTRYLSTFLYGISAADPLTFAAVAVLLTLVALAACYVPARRATRVDPMEALRYE
ncbi:MAG TPA: ABC transporter permease [Candidatus Acidoferrales bacterium]|nr:ABC transporter permease [Candidatus Acidoferrales bacterium]